jgi:hypothetical protein
MGQIQGETDEMKRNIGDYGCDRYLGMMESLADR